MCRTILWSLLVGLLAGLPLSGRLAAHDTWVETGSNYVRPGEYIYVDLRLGNHGNDHRDFKINSKVTLAPCTLEVIDPSGRTHDLKPRVIDMGYGEKEGYWSARFEAPEPGTYEVRHTLDLLKGTTRAVKTSKTYFVCQSASAGKPTAVEAGEDALADTALHWVLETPLATVQSGRELQLRLMFKGKPLADTQVTFIPRGVALAAGDDPDYERITDAQGLVRFMPPAGNVYLIVARRWADDERGAGFDKTHYGATLVLVVPNRALGD